VVGAALNLAVIAVIGVAPGTLLRRTAAGLAVLAGVFLRGADGHELPAV
jgi:hypothetical protein